MGLSRLQHEEEKSWFFPFVTCLPPLSTYCAFCPHNLLLHIADGQSFLFPFLHNYFQDVQKHWHLQWVFAIWKSLPLQTCMHAATYIWYSFFALQMGIKHRGFQNANSLGCYICLFLQYVYSLLSEWGDPKPSILLCSYQVGINTKSGSPPTTKKCPKITARVTNLLNTLSKYLSKQSFLSLSYR